MTASRTETRQLSRERHYSQSSLEETTSLVLSRTRSQEFDYAESVAVLEVSLEDSTSTSPSDDETANENSVPWTRSTRYVIFLCGFLTSLSFGVTQVPLVYIFRLMTCDSYYNHHASLGPHQSSQLSWASKESVISYILSPESFYQAVQYRPAVLDRCSINEIETSTALALSLLGASTTVFGILNLFITGALIKRIGLKATLAIQTFVPAIRLLIQNIGVEVWGSMGINIIQLSQTVSILGGPSGYVLVLNTFITEVVEHDGRTAALGRLGGSMMFGAAFGFLLGGILADEVDIKAPFRLTLVLFLSSCAFGLATLPHVPVAPVKRVDTDLPKRHGKWSALSRLFKPLIVFVPRKFIGRDGVIRTEYGAFLLACGVYIAILATGYLATLLQLYATGVFDFGTKENGFLIFLYSMLRGLFLSFAFPKLILLGRSYTMRVKDASDGEQRQSSEREPLLPSTTHQVDETELNPNNDKVEKKEVIHTFDLTYTRFSLLADGFLTLLCTFVREGWQMYLVAAVLPFSAGTGSASKGTILQMIGSSATSADRTDALAGLSLVENLARMSTTSVFGTVFAAFASIGRTELVFVCNAAVALVGFGVLIFAQFPLEGSIPLEMQESRATAGRQ